MQAPPKPRPSCHAFEADLQPDRTQMDCQLVVVGGKLKCVIRVRCEENGESRQGGDVMSEKLQGCKHRHTHTHTHTLIHSLKAHGVRLTHSWMETNGRWSMSCTHSL